MSDINFRNQARLTGFLFLIGFIGVIAVGLLPATTDAFSVDDFSKNESQILIGIFSLVIMAFTVSCIPISMYPILKQHNDGAAIAAVGFRIIEGALTLIGVVILLFLLSLGIQSGNETVIPESVVQLLGDLGQSLRDYTNALAAFAFNLGALMYNYIFFKKRLISEWLSILGFIAIFLAFITNIFIFFGFLASFATISVLLHFPTIVYELSLAILLITKGYTIEINFDNSKTQN
jgi:hypothetical protein